MNEIKTILGIKITDLSKKDILEKIEKYVLKSKVKSQKSKENDQKPMVIFTPNPEIVMYAQKDKNFKEIVNSAYINIADGVGLLWASRIIGNPIRHRVTGIDLMQAIIKRFTGKPITIGLIGGFDNLALKTLECLKAKYPRLNAWAEEGPRIKMKKSISYIVSRISPNQKINTKYKIPNTLYDLDYDNWKVEAFLERVKERETRILFVGFGFPKQEYFIETISEKLTDIVLVAVGGGFEFLSGKVRRAPKIIRTFGLEWLFRLIQQPWRIKRQLVLPQFIWKVLTLKDI